MDHVSAATQQLILLLSDQRQAFDLLASLPFTQSDNTQSQQVNNRQRGTDR